MWEQFFIGLLIIVVILGVLVALYQVIIEEIALNKRMKAMVEQNIKTREALSIMANKATVQPQLKASDRVPRTNLYGGARSGGKSHFASSYTESKQYVEDDPAIYATVAASVVDMTPSYQYDAPTERDCSPSYSPSYDSGSSDSCSSSSYD